VKFWQRIAVYSIDPHGPKRVYGKGRAGVRALFRTSETALIFLSVGCGLIAGLLTFAQSAAAHLLQQLFYGADIGRLSAIPAVARWSLLALPLGGLVIAGSNRLLKKRQWTPIDVVEANSLFGGVIPLRDSLFVAFQTLVSNGCGASVGLEAAYAQLGGGSASLIGQWLRLRRRDLRILVGAGAGAAVGSAFGAPLAGAFYAFEIVIGAYTPAAIAPVAAAAIAAVLTIRATGGEAYLIALPGIKAITTIDYVLYAGLGILCALMGIVIMRAVTFVEGQMRRLPGPDRLRPLFGGLLLVPLAWLSPQVLSAGHGALHLDLTMRTSLTFLALILLLKISASVLSLGAGFRGGLFFASLFLGSLVGQLFAGLIALIPGAPLLDQSDAALIGMAALGAAIVGGPMTMSLLILEVTHDFALTGTALTAALVSGTLVRETFGYSFSTWRLHTRGESIRGARDVGWSRALLASSMMSADFPTIEETASTADFLHRFPLAPARRVIVIDPHRHYRGVVETAALHAANLPGDQPIAAFSIDRDAVVEPSDGVHVILRAFDQFETDDLVVADANGCVLGALSEKYVRRRYTEELEKAQKDLFRE
jgi:CIC family chloride channel protein